MSYYGKVPGLELSSSSIQSFSNGHNIQDLRPTEDTNLQEKDAASETYSLEEGEIVDSGASPPTTNDLQTKNPSPIQRSSRQRFRKQPPPESSSTSRRFPYPPLSTNHEHDFPQFPPRDFPPATSSPGHYPDVNTFQR